MINRTESFANYFYWGETMKEIKCSHCDKVLSHKVENGHHIEGYYLYNQKAFCADCWDRKESGVVVLARSDRKTDGTGETSWVVIKNGGDQPPRPKPKV